MSQDTRILKLESDEEFGQFLETSIEQFLQGEDRHVRVTEIEPEDI